MPEPKLDDNFRSDFILAVMEDFVGKDESILEIGEGTGRHTKYLREHGYTNVTGIDKLQGTAIEDVPETQYDVIYTMSCLFLIPPEQDWVFEKIARMAKKYIITVEGETTSDKVWGRHYDMVFHSYGFRQVLSQENVFNEYGVLRVLQNERRFT